MSPNFADATHRHGRHHDRCASDRREGDLHTTGEPDVLMSPFVHTIKALPCATG
jgi:hypothetical protein